MYDEAFLWPVAGVAVGALIASGITLVFGGPIGLVIGVAVGLSISAVSGPRQGGLLGACVTAVVGMAVAIVTLDDTSSPLILVLALAALMYTAPGAIFGLIRRLK